ncbi:NAD(P)H-binding protein [Brevibacterium sp. RIT 803]|uniref:NAD(P)-dependent oxidoreductase n=1 Tax=Brevibacterium sp. RIT 803 TaxID=2810210 RepID=UPI00194FB8DF|nr:NAD(P)H-binding protein [Brevibacterium sp. RIT 803]MBM6589248.1 NAD(P)H-binding protein [Brevibacterium sp. RIT 803]
MRIAVIGATGMVGSRIVTEAADRSHQVIAASRAAPHHTRREVTSKQADARSATDIDNVLDGVEAAVLTVRAVPGEEDAFVTITKVVLDASARAGIPVFVVGGAGPLHSPKEHDRLVVDSPAFVPKRWRSTAAASVTQLATCAEHTHQNWTYLSPPAVLEPGIRTGSYRQGTTTLLTDHVGRSHISAEDLAVAVIDELEAPGTEQHITIAHKCPSTYAL